MATETARRRLWIAALLNLAWPGLGHVYCGRPLRGLVFHVASLCLVFLALLLLSLPIGPASLLIPVFVVLLGVTLMTLDAVNCARAAGPEYHLKRYNRWYVYLLLIFASGAENNMLSEMILSRFKTFRCTVATMAPAILAGDCFVVSKNAYAASEPQRGDLVIFPSPDDPETMWIERVVGLPGETFEIEKKLVSINGQQLDEPYANLTARCDDIKKYAPPDSMAPVVIPPGQYFLLGDNRNRSRDSRSIGTLPRSQILGKGKTIFFSWDSTNRRIRWERMGIALE